MCQSTSSLLTQEMLAANGDLLHWRRLCDTIRRSGSLGTCDQLIHADEDRKQSVERANASCAVCSFSILCGFGLALSALQRAE